MTLDTQRRILSSHASAIVRDANQAATAGLQVHADAASPSIDGILEELLDHTGRTLDYLTSGDLVDHPVLEDPDHDPLSSPGLRFLRS
jgi:hypothetical protein